MLRFETNGNGHGGYYLDGTRLWRVSEILAVTGVMPPFYADDSTRNVALQRGTAVHQACDLVDAGTLDWGDLDPLIVGYVRAYEKFRQERDFYWQSREERVYHSELGYAGTLDRAGMFDGNYVIVDLKTSIKIDRWVGLQLAGYALANRRYDGKPVHRQNYRRVALRLGADGAYDCMPFEDPMDLQVFQSLVDVTRWKLPCKAK